MNPEIAFGWNCRRREERPRTEYITSFSSGVEEPSSRQNSNPKVSAYLSEIPIRRSALLPFLGAALAQMSASLLLILQDGHWLLAECQGRIPHLRTHCVSHFGYWRRLPDVLCLLNLHGRTDFVIVAGANYLCMLTHSIDAMPVVAFDFYWLFV